MKIHRKSMGLVTEKEQVIDVHTHPVFFGEGAARAELRGLVRRARAQGIRHMVALGDVLKFGRLPTVAQMREINNETAAVVVVEPGMFRGFCFLNPMLGARAVRREIDRGVQELGLKGIKLEISNNARDERVMGPVMAAAEHYGLPVLQHSWSQTNIKERSFHSDPEDTCLLARRHPRVNIIMAHLTGCGFRGVRAARGLRNIWVDTSGAAPEAGLVEYAVDQLGADRVLYGSDLPIRDLPVAIARVTGAQLTAAARRAVLHDNAADLLKLER
jgi:hypothetical protein